jgi:hypothetical protein
MKSLQKVFGIEKMSLIMLTDFLIVLVSTMAQVRLELAEEEAEDLRSGIPLLHDTSPNTFLHMGLELEEQQ